MFKVIIFDMDDTLIDFRKRKKILIEESVKAMVNAGLKENVNELISEFNKFYWDTGIEDQKIFEKFLIKKYNHVDYKILAHAIIAYRRANAPLLKPYPHVTEVLGMLKEKKMKLALLSDAPKLNVYTRLVEVGMDDIFDIIITADDVGAIKPSPLGFKKIMKTFDVEASECLMVGDSPARDVIGAKNVGMKICLAKYSCYEDVQADYSINSIQELLDILKEN
ncbi:MAG: HAD-IA family hydrolase [Candidatus Woesearchaeota archaeon]